MIVIITITRQNIHYMITLQFIIQFAYISLERGNILFIILSTVNGVVRNR